MVFGGLIGWVMIVRLMCTFVSFVRSLVTIWCLLLCGVWVIGLVDGIMTC